MVISLHDVAPSNWDVASKIISELSRRGVRICSVLVIPDYHHQGLAIRDRQFIRWLRNLEADGHEIVIHGYFHERPPRPNESFRDKFLTRLYTNDEGEFYDLDYEEALRRIRNARDAELEYTTRLRTVRDLRSGEEFSTRSMVYSVRSGWRRAVSCAWNAGLLHFLENNPLLRLSIHPPDYSHPAIWRQIMRVIDKFNETRTPTTYRDWVAEQRLMVGRRG